MIFLFLATGCVDDDILARKDGELRPGDPLTLTFTIGVPTMGEDGAAKTRAIYYGNPVHYEDWIDTQDGLRVLFFLTRREKDGPGAPQGEYGDNDQYVAIDKINPLRDYFLFESTSRWAEQLPYDEDGSLRYQVTVPMYQIGNQNPQYRDDWETIRGLLREYDFKIAILANHPADSGVEWTRANSVLSAPNIHDLSTAKNIKTINDLHHSKYDNNYTTGGSGRTEGYKMLRDANGNMGPDIDCVIMRSELYGDALGGTFTTRATAKTWIRDYWRPDLKYNENTDPDIEYERLYHDYRHIWSYWNFGGAAADNALPYSSKSRTNTHIGEWEERNSKMLRSIIVNAAETNSGKLPEISTASNAEGKWDASRPVTLHPSGAKGVITSGNNGTRFYGISIPAISKPSSTSAADCFSFTTTSKGTITVRYLDNGGGKVAAVCASQADEATTSSTINGQKVTEYSIFTGSGTPQTVYVYASSGTPVVLDIEYTADEYIYLTDREGILPSSDHPIPMYGVQKFDRLEGYWDEGASFDLTTGGQDEAGNHYQPKKIFLIRAVAKIELLVPKSLGVPSHVYMRSLNRHTRCEPMDVSTPTDQLWKDHDTECEWIMIQNRGPMYDNGKYTESSYQKKMCWFYGSWLEWGWNFNGHSAAPSKSDGPFPRIMNPKINRSDYAAFIDVSDYYNDQYYHFLFYMGENTLDAPSNYAGSSSQMVPHIELRFDERYASTSKIATNSSFNLTDTDCYRIYITEGGIAKGARDANGASTISKDGYAAYETNPNYLKEHWPIIRNHVYRFTVRDTNSDNMHALVVDAQNRSVDFNFK